jgi:hypothetical protein
MAMAVATSSGAVSAFKGYESMAYVIGIPIFSAALVEDIASDAHRKYSPTTHRLLHRFVQDNPESSFKWDMTYRNKPISICFDKGQDPCTCLTPVEYEEYAHQDWVAFKRTEIADRTVYDLYEKQTIIQLNTKEHVYPDHVSRFVRQPFLNHFVLIRDDTFIQGKTLFNLLNQNLPEVMPISTS